ncbi:transposase family protein [Arsenicicoccus bolidensis]|uniref:Transposase n=1 Tax=Arsenicicoccus bolidensis TaxID=229480 RepID=A0ABS9Q9F7_9MICO|nr:transposase family protein [Arsenicicoccus bolidensis]MCG7323743.1 transposase [Arsenicicoccus bolidensis]
MPVPVVVVRRVSAWLQAHRRAHDKRPWQQAATCWTQAVLFLRWLIDATGVHRLARDAGLSQATAYRYLHEAITVVAERQPDLHEVVAGQLVAGAPFVCLDGTLIHTNRCSTPSTSGNGASKGNDAWYSGKHHHHGGNVQVLTDSTGFPIWTSPVEPGSTHDITAARTHALPALYAAAAKGLPTLADKGYTGAGIGIHTPFKGATLAPGNRTYNRIQRALRAPAERANAILKTYRALRNVTLDPNRIGAITAAALVIATMTRGRW